ncbi:MAG: hypothetical protein ACLP7Q_17005, partial [Isosphaeraceae bacterium]
LARSHFANERSCKGQTGLLADDWLSFFGWPLTLSVFSVPLPEAEEKGQAMLCMGHGEEEKEKEKKHRQSCEVNWS